MQVNRYGPSKNLGTPKEGRISNLLTDDVADIPEWQNRVRSNYTTGKDGDGQGQALAEDLLQFKYPTKRNHGGESLDEVVKGNEESTPCSTDSKGDLSLDPKKSLFLLYLIQVLCRSVPITASGLQGK